MIRDLTPSAISMGLLATFTGYSASFTIVLSGLQSAGATQDQAATGLFFATLGMGICSIWLPLVMRIPAAVAWSTPGAAFLVSIHALPGGFAEAVGALFGCAVLIFITGIIPALGRLVTGVPKPVANALLAGVLLKLCFAPALALGSMPLLVLPMLIAWMVGLMWHKMAAMPLAVAAFAAVLALILPQNLSWSNGDLLPPLAPLMPHFTFHGFISVAVPLYLVTMAGQNIPGFAVLELNGYEPQRQPALRKTGLVSLLIAPFGSIPMNMSAITAAMMAGEDAGHDPSKRYWAAMVAGLAYLLLAFLAAPVALIANLAPPELITAVAGLALIPALVASLSGAFAEPSQIEAPALTFLMAASGMALFGISGAFWGVVTGSLVWFLKKAAKNRVTSAR